MKNLKYGYVRNSGYSLYITYRGTVKVINPNTKRTIYQLQSEIDRLSISDAIQDAKNILN
jgi:hypothetical protein